MKSITTSSDLVYSLKSSKLRVKSPNKVNLCREVKRRWLIGAILFAVFLAVVAPNLGAYGGNYIACSLLDHSRTHCTHKAMILLLITKVLLFWKFTEHNIMLTSLITLSLGNNCPWLSIALQSRDSRTLSQVVAASATGWIIGLVTAPISLGLVCGHYQLPPLSSVLPIITAFIPFLIGYLYNYYFERSTKSAEPSTNSSEQSIRNFDPSTRNFDQPTKCHDKSSELCAVLLVYAECCEQLTRQGSGGVAISDVIGSLVVVVLWLFFCAMSCVVLSVYCQDQSKVVLMSALPKSIDVGWHMSSTCATMGL